MKPLIRALPLTVLTDKGGNGGGDIFIKPFGDTSTYANGTEILSPDGTHVVWFHQAPASGGHEWHVHAHVAPPLRAPGVPRFVASGELGSGLLSSPVVPEEAAQALRDA